MAVECDMRVSSIEVLDLNERFVYSWFTKSNCYGTYLPYGITQCYLPPDTSERAPAWTPASKPALDLPTLERWKAKFT